MSASIQSCAIDAQRRQASAAWPIRAGMTFGMEERIVFDGGSWRASGGAGDDAGLERRDQRRLVDHCRRAVVMVSGLLHLTEPARRSYAASLLSATMRRDEIGW
jgi:hypothetical protein